VTFVGTAERLTELEHAFSRAEKAAVPEGPAACRRPERSPQAEATDLIAFVVAVVFFFCFQPKNRMSSPKTA
jgi:hypothetical protein